MIAAASVLPASIAGFYFGAWVGAAGGFALLPLTWALFAYVGFPDSFLDFVSGGAIIGTATVSVVGAGVGFVTDITRRLRQEIAERQRVQTALNALNGQLETQAQRALKARAQFLTAISHKLRTPLNTSMGASSLLLESELDALQRSQVGDIIRGNSETVQIIDSILEYTKVQSGDLCTESAEFDLKNLLDALISRFQPQSLAQATQVNTTISPLLTSQNLIGDAKHLDTILGHLLSNALKATRNGVVNISVEIGVEVAAERKASSGLRSEFESSSGSTGKSLPQTLFTFTMQDNGIGMPDSMVDKIFEPFGTAYETTTNASSGACIGLALCHTLCHKLGGTISIESQLGTGTSASVRLPFVRAEAKPKAPTANHRRYHVSSQEPLKRSMHILLAEDNLLNAKLAIRMLEKLGHTVQWVENGQEAVGAVEDAKYDLILMDIQMPELDGLEATAQIRSQQDQHRPPYIIALTADTMLESPTQQREYGFDGYIGKPITLEKLSKSLPTLSSQETQLDPHL